MTPATVLPSPPAGRNLIAPVWHTVLLVLIFFGLAVGGAVFQRNAQATPGMLQQHPNVVPLYLSTMGSEWLLIYGVWAGIHRRGGKLRDLIGGRWASARDVLGDLALALIVWVLWLGIQYGVVALWGTSQARSISVLLPQRGIEVFLWFVVSITAGISEEITFRGYFQKQFEAMTGSAAAGLILQGVLFGISHGYQGLRAVTMILLYGLLYGVVASTRKSLRPGIIAHGWSDVYAGYLYQFLPH
jgi:membrane protease YdiL (CAAX protease family)